MSYISNCSWKYMASMNYSPQWVKACYEIGETPESVNKNFKYWGGDRGRHRNYLLKTKKVSIEELPEHVNECLCGHYIEENCYIIDEVRRPDQVIILGNCCIKKFIVKSGRTCKICGNSHRNRKVDKCNECRKGTCDNCDSKCGINYDLCYDCYVKFG